MLKKIRSAFVSRVVPIAAGPNDIGGAGWRSQQTSSAHSFRTRRILVVLAERGVVALQANRGAYVASPDAGAAREVFEARDPAFYRALRNDRLLAVAVHAKLHADLKSIKELNPRVLDEEPSFATTTQMDGKEFEPLKRAGPDAAASLIHEAQEASGKKQAA